MPDIGAASRVVANEPKNVASPKAKTPPSAPTSQ
jgi:hypothetical protein